MAEAFEPITTQEAFDAAVEQRLAPYADYNEIKAQNEKYAGQIVELNSRIQTYEMDPRMLRWTCSVPLRTALQRRWPRVWT